MNSGIHGHLSSEPKGIKNLSREIMASVDSGVETGNESNDDPKLDSKFPKANLHADQMALVPAQRQPADTDEATTWDVFPTGVRKVFLLHPLDGQGLGKKLDGQRPLDIDIDPPSGLSFLNLQPSSLPPGLGYEVFPSERSWGLSHGKCSLVHYEHDDQMNRGHKMRALYNRKVTRWKQFHGPLSERKLRVAVSTNNIEMVQQSLSNGVNPNCYDGSRRAPLHLAACRGYADIVRLLLEFGADPNQRDSLGNTPLHLAACTNNIVVVTLLLKAGTDVSSSDCCGRSPLQLAQSKLKLLQKHFGKDVAVHIKNQVYQVIEMMLEFLHKRGQDSEAELLSAFSSRLTLSETKEQVETQVRDLLESLSGLSLESNSNNNSNSSTSSCFSSSSSSSGFYSPCSPMGGFGMRSFGRTPSNSITSSIMPSSSGGASSSVASCSSASSSASNSADNSGAGTAGSSSAISSASSSGIAIADHCSMSDISDTHECTSSNNNNNTQQKVSFFKSA